MLAQAALRAVPSWPSEIDLVKDGVVCPVASFSRGSSATLWDGTAQRTFGVDVPRFDSKGRLVVEAAATNLCPSSTRLGALDGDAIVTSDAALSPFGPASLVADNPATTQHHLILSGIPSAGTTFTVSVAAKASRAPRYLAFRGAGLGGNFPVFDPKAGIVVNLGGQWDAASIRSLGDGWFLCTATGTAPAAYYVLAHLVNTQTWWDISHDGVANCGLYMTRVQVEIGATATSYVPTDGATATRAADVLTVTLPGPQTIHLVGMAADGTEYTETSPLIIADHNGPWICPPGLWAAIRAQAA